jgi:hypothetical protein
MGGSGENVLCLTLTTNIPKNMWLSMGSSSGGFEDKEIQYFKKVGNFRASSATLMFT